MATQAQINANRLNAQKSTGPRTPDGKAAIRQNALRHGLCVHIPVLQHEAPRLMMELLQLMREENQPVGVNEEILVYKMAEHFFFQRRASEFLTTELELIDENGFLGVSVMLRYH